MRFTTLNFKTILCFSLFFLHISTSFAQITYLDFSGLSSTNSLINQPIGATGFTFSATITNSVAGISEPWTNSDGKMTLRMSSSTSVQCLNLSFPLGAEVYITDHPTAGTGNVFNTNDSVLLSTSSFIFIDPLNNFDVYSTSFTPNTGVASYTTWSATLYGSNNYSICAMTTPSSPSGNDKIPLRIGVITATLPIEFTGLDLSCEKQTLHLDWKTLSERSNDYFMIETSSDGTHWHPADTLKGAGSSFEEISYHSTLNAFENRIKYIRLSQVDFDGNKSVLAERSIPCTSTTHLPYPNPTKSKVNFQINPETIKSLQVFNCLSQELPTDEWEMNTTSSQIEINIEKLLPGIYLVQINDEIYRVVKY